MPAPTTTTTRPTTPRRRARPWKRRTGALGMAAALLVGGGSVLVTGGESASAIGTARKRVIEITNQRRVEHGLRRLRANDTLNRVAQQHSRDQARHHRMSHTGSDGSDPGERLTRAGYVWSAWGENVAAGYPSARSVMRAWMASPGHQANILDGTYTRIGVGRAAADDGTLYWTMVLARPG